jgi:hypothetical protein
MANNRIIYQSEALYVSDNYDSTGTGQHAQLSRVQSANYSFTVPRTDINQYGVLSRIGTLNTETPTVSVDLSYYLTNGFNEAALGFYVETGTGLGSLTQGFGNEHLLTDTGRNIYILTVPEGEDAIGNSGNLDNAAIIGIGNTFLTDYTLDLSVGSIPTVTVSMEGQNIISDSSIGTGVGGNNITGITNAGVNPTSGTAVVGAVTLALPTVQTGTDIPIALRPGDVTITFGTNYTTGNQALVQITGDTDAAHIQSLSLSLPLSRTALEKLGSRFAYARAVDFPVNATLTINAIVNEQSDQALTQLLNDTTTFDITASIKDPSSTIERMRYVFKGCQLQDEAYSSSIGANKTVDLTFTTQIGGPSDTDNNILVSGSYTGQRTPFSD